MTGPQAIRVEIVQPERVDELRRAVLRPDTPIGTSTAEMAPPDAVTLAALEDGGRVVGTCVIFEAACPERPGVDPAWQLRGMAVDPGVQRGGIGSAVLQAAIEQTRARDGVLLWCNARDPAISFYERHGFVVTGDGFLSPATGIPHHAMWLELPAPPTSSH